MPRTAFTPATLDLLPGEPAQPPLRLLEHRARPSHALRPPVSTPAHTGNPVRAWLGRLVQRSHC